MLVDAWSKNDMASFASLFTGDASYVSGAGIWLKGRESIRQGLSNEEASTGERRQVAFTDSQIKLIKADVAVVHNTWELTGGSAQAGEGVKLRKGVITLVMVNAEDGWRIAALQNTDVKERNDNDAT